MLVPRPELGDLVKQFNDEPTLYDQILRVDAAAGERHTSVEWHEETYDQATDTERWGIQQRVWRRGRGEETENDLRMEFLEEHEARVDRGEGQFRPTHRSSKWYDEEEDIRHKRF